jgi:hypothetical protein
MEDGVHHPALVRRSVCEKRSFSAAIDDGIITELLTPTRAQGACEVRTGAWKPRKY